MTSRFPAAVDAALRTAGWRPGRRDMRQAEIWADSLRAHTSPGGHRHALFPAVVEAWAEFGGLRIVPDAPGRDIAPTPLLLDPAPGLHWARTLTELGRALGTQIAPLGLELGAHPEPRATALLVMDREGRVYSLDHSGDYYLGPDFDAALATLLDGVLPTRLTLTAGPTG